ncbi:BASS family bile acid:Na+ symporter [Novosphingobium sp. PhB57]|nr:BASS family bile acid:Na+ symporter [Novosphingobium sp. PhB57]
MAPGEIVKFLLLGSIFLTVFALALRARPADVFYLFQEWRLGLRALTAMYIVVPVAAILIATAFDVKPVVKLVIVALAFSPVPPLLPKKQIKAGISASYVTGLFFAASLASLAITPLGLHLAGVYFGVDTEIAPAKIASILAVGVGGPLFLGFVVGKMLDERVAKVADVIAKVSAILFILCVLVLLVVLAPAILKVIGDGTIVVLVAMNLVGLAAGHWLAGGNQDERLALSLASAARHPGVAIAIAATNFPDAKMAPAAIVLSAILNGIITIPYIRLLANSDAAPRST